MKTANKFDILEAAMGNVAKLLDSIKAANKVLYEFANCRVLETEGFIYRFKGNSIVVNEILSGQKWTVKAIDDAAVANMIYEIKIWVECSTGNC